MIVILSVSVFIVTVLLDKVRLFISVPIIKFSYFDFIKKINTKYIWNDQIEP